MELNPLTNLPENDKPVDNTSLDTKSIMEALQPIPVETSAGFSGMENIDFSKWEGVNRKIGSDNEEARAQSQTWWDLTKGATAQAAATVIGGSIEGTGYLLDLFNIPKMAKLMQGEDAEFGNILSEFGKGIQEYTREEIAPIYQTRAAQEGWALGDGTWWASNAPSLASTLSIMVPVFAARSAVMLGARTLNKSIRATKTGAKVLDDIADSSLVQRLNNRKINNFAEQAGLAFTSRHIENSMESASVYQDILDRKIAEGFSEDEAKQIAGESAAQTYRLGYMNMWQDVIQWNMLLKGSYANRAIAAGGKAGNKKVQDAVSKLREQYGDSGIIPAAALTKAGVNKKDILLNAFGEGFEEFNQNFIQSYGNDYADYLSGNTSKEPPKGFLESYFSRDFIDQATDKKAWDATFWGFLGGLVFGGAAKYGVFDKSVDFMTRKNQMDNVNYMQREGAKFEYIKTLSNNILKYEAEGNIALRDANTDKLAMAITLGQIVDGNTGIAIDSAIHDGRYQDTYDNLKKIAETPDNQLDTQEKKDAKAVAQRLLPQMEKIKNVFEKNYQNKYDENYDLAIASAMTEYQFLSEEYEKRIGEYDSKIEELRNDIAVPSADVKEIAQLQIQVKGAEKAIENAKEELKQLNDFINSEDKSKLTRSQLQEPGYIQAGIDEIEKDISAAKERIAEIKKENQDDQLDLFVDAYTDANQQLVELETAKKLIGNLSKNYAEKLAKLHTKEGKDEYIKEIKKADKERQAKVEKAAVNEAKTQDEVDAVPVETSEGKKAVTEKTKEISRENKAKTKLGEEATPETIAEEVEKDKQRESVKQSKEESFKKANVPTWWIKKLESETQQERESLINRTEMPSEARKFLLEFSDLLEKEKEVADVTEVDKSNQEQVEIAKAIDEGTQEPVESKSIDDVQIGDKFKPIKGAYKDKVGIVERIENTIGLRFEDGKLYNYSIDNIVAVVSEPVIKEQPDVIPPQVVEDTPVIEEDKSVRSQSFKSTQESNTKGNGDFSLNFKIVDGKAVTDKSGVQTSNPSLDNSHATKHTVRTGDKVTLQLAKDSTYTPTPIYIVHEGVPMATLPSSYKEFAETIRPLLQAGEIIETTIGNDGGWIQPSNVNNVIINGKYYNVPLIDLEQIYNHRGKVGFPITLAFSTGNEYSLEGGKLSLPDATVKQLTDYFVQDYIDNVEDNQQDAKTFADNTINQIISEINNTKLTVGQNDDITLTGLPHIIVPAPNGLWKALRLENSKLTKTHVDYILDNIVKEENLTPIIQNINSIVYANSDKENHSITPPPERTEGLHTAKRNKHFRLAEAGNELVIEFYSPTLETIVLTTNKRIQNNEYKVIAGLKKNEQGNFVTQYGKAPQELDLMDELRNFLSTKNFNIEIDKLGLKDYVSPVTGYDKNGKKTNVEYPTYFDYLTSQNELAGNEFSDNNLAKSILSTTIAPVDNSPFHNVMWNYNPVTYRNKEIMQDVIAEKPVNKTQIKKAEIKPEAKITINPDKPNVVKNLDSLKDMKKGLLDRETLKKEMEQKAKERKKECKG